MDTKRFVIGVDYGTDSVRTLIVDAADGTEVSSAVFHYPRWRDGKYCDPARNQFRQHPLDYIEGLECTVRQALLEAPVGTAEKIAGLSVDTTGSTPVAVDRQGTPLALLAEFAENPNAMFVLWKDHTAVDEAGEINTLARSWGGIDYTQYEGGIYSSEWFWAKLLHILREDPAVRKAAFSWVEHCDWIPAMLTGQTDPLTIKRSRCAAGHKAMWHESYGGLPSEEFLGILDPLLAGLRGRLFEKTYTSDISVGTLTADWARRLGLYAGVQIGVGAFDAHMGAVGGEITPYVLLKIMGTSTCDMLVAPPRELGNRLVKGICGQVDGSIIPGMIGLEAGQSAFGDVYAWFRDLLLWPIGNVVARSELLDERTKTKVIEEATERMITTLSMEAARLPVDESGILALDWMNGRRTPDANQLLKGAITGLTLGSDAPRMFRALVESTAFGARKIVERFRSEGVRIEGVIAIGGVAKKSPFIMQVVADVLDMPIKVPRSEQTCALGASMCAAVAAGIYQSVEEAKQGMGSGIEQEYRPDPVRAKQYDTLYNRYGKLGEYVEQEIQSMRRQR
ncbi:MAG: ribulokinase [Ignavibacteriales bacterium]|nr:ribulokinase [Ignavibacteriales bacterium]